MFKRIIILYALLFSMADAKTNDMQFNELKTPVIVTQQQPVVAIKIKSNKTTGFSWSLVSYNSHLIKPISSKYFPATSQLVGASGYELWTFCIAPIAFEKPQTIKIIMRYARPWVKEGGILKTITFKTQ